MPSTRPTAVAGLFYPADPEQLHDAVTGYLATVTDSPGPRPKALIVPHAGYVYSGPTAASAYATLAPYRDTFKRVVLLGPSHRVPFLGLATPDVDAFTTPLGEIPLDIATLERLEGLQQVHRLPQAHQLEHSLEVQLPFLQELLAEFQLVPLVVGEATIAEVSEVLGEAWGDEATLIVISSDLSHYHDYATASRLDRSTCEAITALDPNGLGEQSACGRIPIRGLLDQARRRNLSIALLDLRNSGDTAGDHDRVVGYGSFLLH